MRRAALVTALCFAAIAAPSASAHGGLQIATVRTGGYTARVDALLVSLSPTRTMVDFTTVLSRGGRPVDDADFRVTARTPDGTFGPLRALPGGNTYEVLVPIRDPRQWRKIRLAATIAGPEGAASFHYSPPSLASDWRPEWSVVAGCLLALLLFAQGFMRLRRRGRKDLAGWDRAVLFIAAIALTYLALDSPLDAIADDYLLSAHMLEHVVIGDIAIALAMLAVRGPLVFFLLPPQILSPLARNPPLRAFLHWLTGPWVALTVWTAGMWAWHIPRIYDYAATHQTVHDLEHLSFILGGVLIWNLLIDPAQAHRLTVPTRILLAVGVLLLGEPVVATLFAGGAHYTHYASQPDRLLGIGPQLDQRLAGTVMLTEQILALGACCTILLWPYLRGDQRVAGGLGPGHLQLASPTDVGDPSAASRLDTPGGAVKSR